ALFAGEETARTARPVLGHHEIRERRRRSAAATVSASRPVLDGWPVIEELVVDVFDTFQILLGQLQAACFDEVIVDGLKVRLVEILVVRLDLFVRGEEVLGRRLRSQARRTLLREQARDEVGTVRRQLE